MGKVHGRLGGTMRLGSYPCTLKKDSMAYAIYQQTEIFKRYRHRYGFNALFRQSFEAAGMVFSGYTLDDDRIEIVELQDHPYFIGVQFHPELKSRVFDPHKLFLALIKVVLARSNSKFLVEKNYLYGTKSN
ncbi:MAG: gamma-glutamyl-gamma-aminobutyrate hydrolase family protein [Amoebophilaceae bacterium]|nr:gamma-glutamyl-gamma-aminobutyrate hydrolase family protein [Amoebophilaceae bacterium]